MHNWERTRTEGILDSFADFYDRAARAWIIDSAKFKYTMKIKNK